jgi:hypothetical protein
MKSLQEISKVIDSDRISDMPKARQAIKTTPEESARKSWGLYEPQVFL